MDSLVTLQQLKYFIEVAASGSITRAAAALYVAQPSLSKSMKEIEARVGRELFTRTAQGISLTPDGVEFLGYARQVVQQADLLEQRYADKKPPRRLCSISTQHYAFAVNAFVNMVRRADTAEYEFTLRETRTHDIIEDVATLRSDIGILYRNPFNQQVLDKIFRTRGLAFHPLFTARPHVFVSRTNPLAGRASVSPADLADYPCLSFDQGVHNSFYFAEEILSTEFSPKAVRVSDRATIFNLMIGLNGYTISTGILSTDLNGENIVSVPLEVDDHIEVGWIAPASVQLTGQARTYLDELERVLAEEVDDDS
ncbi:LysR family transcriptional regulator [Bogoriella caseilytica]|uniref:DNA-binding transcriptional LysR family regulator n=1 Tax=Bogoriella caseilytica TaxID=56055 RepID=A0A3N2BFW6_9MICO|nr:LysR family transcriptional regulator [Bogoriella caseilytica]ROR74153.1 DNA-binding transcriptional LysR family regulator [Bogoriella caseilytica]